MINYFKFLLGNKGRYSVNSAWYGPSVPGRFFLGQLEMSPTSDSLLTPVAAKARIGRGVEMC